MGILRSMMVEMTQNTLIHGSSAEVIGITMSTPTTALNVLNAGRSPVDPPPPHKSNTHKLTQNKPPRTRVKGVGEQNNSKNTNGRAMRACPIDGILAAIAVKSRLNSQKYTQKITYITSKLPGNGDTAPAMAVLGAFGRDPATPGSALFYFYFCVNNRTNNTHIVYSRDLTGGEGLEGRDLSRPSV
jgi:hypothetical protein